MSKRKLSDISAQEIAPKKSFENPFNDVDFTALLDSPDSVFIFFVRLSYCIEKNIPINCSIFSRFIKDQRVYYKKWDLTSAMTDLIKKTKIEETTRLFNWFSDFLEKNKEHQDYSYCVVYICFLLSFCPRELINRYSKKYYPLIEKILQNGDEEFMVICDKINMEITFPFLSIFYLFKEDEYVSHIALEKISQKEFKILFEKHGEQFLLNSLEFYVEKANKWTWKPTITKNLKKNIMDQIDSFVLLKDCVEVGILNMDDAIRIVKLGVCKLDENSFQFYSFCSLFKESKSVFGKFARFVRERTPDNHYDIFKQRPFFFSELEQIQLIKSIIPINLEFFGSVSSLSVFIEGFKNVAIHDIIPVLEIIDLQYCSKLGISLPTLRNIIEMQIRIINMNNKGLIINWLKRAICQTDLNLNLAYLMSPFVLSDRDKLFENYEFFEWFIAAFALSGQHLKFTEQELQIYNSIPDYQRIISYVVNELKQSPHFIILTRKIYWVADNILYIIIHPGVYPDFPNHIFSGISLVWNKLNKMYRNFLVNSPIFKDTLKFIEIFNNFSSENPIENFLFTNLFIQFNLFCKDKNLTGLECDVFRMINPERKQDMRNYNSSRFLIKHLTYLEDKKKRETLINRKIFFDLKTDKKAVKLKSLFPDKKAISEFQKRRDELKEMEYQRLNFKDCAICMEKSLHFTKLNCDCNYDFCAGCIAHMRYRSYNRHIQCPTCRKDSSPREETTNYNKLSA